MTLTLDYRPAVGTTRDVEHLIGNTPLVSFRHVTAHLPETV
ncbi:MAG: hypothetical protein U0521_15320 [Anaerolineae bacterium]